METAEQLARLRAIGCDLAQGYLFSRPVPAEQIFALLDNRFGLDERGPGPSVHLH